MVRTLRANGSCWPSRAGIARVWIVPSRPSNAPWRSMARRSTCGTRSCTTCTWWRPWRRPAPSSSTRPTRVPEGDRGVLARTASPRPSTTTAAERSLQVIDATCPLVTKVHNEAKRFARDDYDILLIGHEGHEEVVGTAGEAPEHVQVVDNPDAVDNVTVRDPNKVIWLSQTTLSVDETMETVRRLRDKFPTLQDPPSDDICYATQNRQVAVKAMAPEVRTGDRGGFAQLVELGAAGRGGPRRRLGGFAPLVDYAEDIDPTWLEGVTTVGVTSGASVPEVLVRGVLERLADYGYGPCGR